MSIVEQRTIEDQVRGVFVNCEVVKRNITLAMGDETISTPHYGLFMPGRNWECLPNAFKKGYEPHTIDDVVAIAEAATEAFSGECQVESHWNNGHIVSICPSNSYRKQIFGTADNVFPRLFVKALYTGRKFLASIGFFRDTCSNLAMLQSNGVGVSKSLSHTESLRDKMAVLIDEIRQVANGWTKTTDAIERMESNQVNIAEFIRKVYPMSAVPSSRATTIAAHRVESIINRVIRERAATGRPPLKQGDLSVSAWEAYNGVQGYVLHDAHRKSGNPMDRALAAFGDKNVRAAEVFALDPSKLVAGIAA